MVLGLSLEAFLMVPAGGLVDAHVGSYVSRCLGIYACMHPCMYACMYLCVCVCVCMHVWIYECVHACVYAYMYICMYVLLPCLENNCFLLSCRHTYMPIYLCTYMHVITRCGWQLRT